MVLAFSSTEVTIEELAQRHRSNRLNLEPAFQRQSVWTQSDRSRLAESIIAGYPMPALFFHIQEGRGGSVSYDVIDGKQRIEAILGFMNDPAFDSWDFIRARMPLPDGTDHWVEWRDMSSTDRYEFNKYRIQAIEVTGDLGDIVDLFVRINSTGRRLTRAETRHARYYTSPLLKAAQVLATQWSRELAQWRVISPSQRQRMKDVELMTELLLAAANGGPLNQKKALDRALQNASLDKAAIDRSRRSVVAAFNALQGVLPNLCETRFHALTDFYTLVVLLMGLRSEGKIIGGRHSKRNALAQSLLTTFSQEVDRLSVLSQQLKPAKAGEDTFITYLRTVKEGTDKLEQRQAREKVLRLVLNDVFEGKDGHRRFNEVQRRIVWNANATHECGICGQVIKRFDDMHLDHVVAHASGGPTTLANAQLSHAHCNLRKGAT